MYETSLAKVVTTEIITDDGYDGLVVAQAVWSWNAGGDEEGESDLPWEFQHCKVSTTTTTVSNDSNNNNTSTDRNPLMELNQGKYDDWRSIRRTSSCIPRISEEKVAAIVEQAKQNALERAKKTFEARAEARRRWFEEEEEDDENSLPTAVEQEPEGRSMERINDIKKLSSSSTSKDKQQQPLRSMPSTFTSCSSSTRSLDNNNNNNNKRSSLDVVVPEKRTAAHFKLDLLNSRMAKTTGLTPTTTPTASPMPTRGTILFSPIEARRLQKRFNQRKLQDALDRMLVVGPTISTTAAETNPNDDK
eukprot:scaffold4565_cov74-Cylindrotheca_fusiformis.AAC.3